MIVEANHQMNYTKRTVYSIFITTPALVPDSPWSSNLIRYVPSTLLLSFRDFFNFDSSSIFLSKINMKSTIVFRCTGRPLTHGLSSVVLAAVITSKLVEVGKKMGRGIK